MGLMFEMAISSSNSVGVAISRRRYPQQAIAFSRSSYLAGINVAVAYRMVINLLPLGRALKNYRYFHFIGVVRRHYRAFTRRSGYDVW